jgi:K+-sensing histidine kinase KdpD
MQRLGVGKFHRAVLESSYHMRMTRRTASWIGAGGCTIAAAVATLIFNRTSFERMLPLSFLAVIVLIAIRFGKVAGIVGTLAAASVFATFLFQPTLSFLVEDAASRNQLVWMLLIGVVASDLLGPHTVPRTRNKS